MKVIDSTSTDVYFNLAMEEYLFKNFIDTDYLILWKNHDSIVLGKHQNIFEEINLLAVEKSEIQVARRNTGGGTVFHDEQNLNYSFITSQEEGFSNYDQFLTPMISALNKIGIPAVKRRNSDIAIGEQKISGSAQTIKKGRVLHHGTLLFDSDLSLLKKLLKPTDGKITSKSVKSVRSDVTNVKKHLDDPSLSLDDFKERLLENLFPDGFERISLTKADIVAIGVLIAEKYALWEWNYGLSPKFHFEKQSLVSDKDGQSINVVVKLEISKGIIAGCQVMVDELVNAEIQEALTGVRYGYQEILRKLSGTGLIGNIELDALTACFL